jgi:asparagine synthase (glutamine-hydrolysing)
VSGICGICEDGRTFQLSALDPMLARLAMSGESAPTSIRMDGAVVGVSPRWGFQQAAAVGNILVAADAELVNSQELASDLRAAGFRGPLESLSDLLAAQYRQFGDGMVEKLDGAFSIALWDRDSHRLLLAVDRLGISTLFWRLEHGRLLFASRAGAVGWVQDAPAQVNQAAIMQFLLFSGVSAPLSVYQGTHRLEPGHLLVWQSSQVIQKRYWDIDYVEDASRSAHECAMEVREGIRAAVFRTARDCQPEATGAYLSGGTDSSSVVAFLSEWHAPAKSFTIFFDEGQYSEIEYARTAARRFNTRHYEQCLKPSDAFDVVSRLNHYYDEPFANSSAIGGYYCARLARENGVTTLLAGDGGDELFGGNERYAADKRFSLYHVLPQFLRKGLIEPIVSLLPLSSSLLSLPRKYVRRANISNPTRIFSYGLFLSEPPQHIFAPSFLEAAPPGAWMSIAQNHFDVGQNRSELNRLLYTDVKMILADNDLRKVLGTAELAGVRARFPLLDHQLVELSSRIPTKWKLKGFEKRFIFKQAMTGILPPKILQKKKHGFGVPVSLWLLQDPRLESLMLDVMSDARTRQRGIFQPEFIDQVIRRHRSEDSKNFGELLWYLLMLELWHREHFETKLDHVCAP